MTKKINTPYGELDLKIYTYPNKRIAILLYMSDGELFDDLTINLSNQNINSIDEGFINSSIHDLTTDDFNMIDVLLKEGVISNHFGKCGYNFGSYDYVKFNLDVLKEYDVEGYINFIKEVGV